MREPECDGPTGPLMPRVLQYPHARVIKHCLKYSRHRRRGNASDNARGGGVHLAAGAPSRTLTAARCRRRESAPSERRPWGQLVRGLGVPWLSSESAMAIERQIAN